MKWQKRRPNYACIFVGKIGGNFYLERFDWVEYKRPKGRYYLTWQSLAGSEFGEQDTCQYDEYLVLKKLPKPKGVK